jgi:predicted transcriptional regulator
LAKQLTEYAKKEEYSLKPFTKEDIQAMIDQSERDIAEGRVYDFDEVMDELEKEFAEEDRELEMARAI